MLLVCVCSKQATNVTVAGTEVFLIVSCSAYVALLHWLWHCCGVPSRAQSVLKLYSPTAFSVRTCYTG